MSDLLVTGNISSSNVTGDLTGTNVSAILSYGCSQEYVDRADNLRVKEASLGTSFIWDDGFLVVSGGTIGIQGVQGTQGMIGSQGTMGVQGMIGPQGISGTTGTQGLQGTTGSQGNTGSQGTIGSQGLTGIQGIQGRVGTQGTIGVQGTIGAQGISGIQGLSGIQGAVGIQGTQGVQGRIGTQGTVGSQGTQGVQGRIGTQGIIGSQGTQGTTGTFGVDASVHLYTIDPSIAWVNAKALGDITMTSASTWYNGRSLSVPAGTWLVTGTITMGRTSTTATRYSARITNGTTHYASASQYAPSVNPHYISISLSTILTLASTTTIYISGYATTSSCVIKGAVVDGASGNNATQLSAVKLNP